MPCKQCIGIEAQFDYKVARRELRRYRKSGLKPQTQLLLGELKRIGVKGRSLLDIGGGVGAIQHECAAEGASTIISVDASPAYLATAKAESERLGYSERSTYLFGDFAELADEVGSADLVTMDRVLCCYPHLTKLLAPAAASARVGLGLIFPRDNWLTRTGARLANLMLKIRGSEFRAFVHPRSEIESCVGAEGLSPTFSATKGLWRVALFVRR